MDNQSENSWSSVNDSDTSVIDVDSLTRFATALAEEEADNPSPRTYAMSKSLMDATCKMCRFLLANQQATDTKLLSQSRTLLEMQAELARQQSEIAALKASLLQLSGKPAAASPPPLDYQPQPAAADPDFDAPDPAGLVDVELDPAEPAPCSPSPTDAVPSESPRNTFWREESDNDSVCSELDLDAVMDQHADNPPKMARMYTDCSELDLDAVMAQHADNLPITGSQAADAAPPQPAPAIGAAALSQLSGVMQQIFDWFGSFRARSKKREELARREELVRDQKLARQLEYSRRVFGHMDAQAAEIRHRVELTEAKLHAVYGDPNIENPSSHPKVKKLYRTLAIHKRAAAALNAKRYEMRRSVA